MDNQTLLDEATLTGLQSDVLILNHKLDYIYKQVSNLNIAVTALTYIPVIAKEFKPAFDKAIQELNNEINTAQITKEDYGDMVEKESGVKLADDELTKKFEELKANINSVIRKTKEK